MSHIKVSDKQLDELLNQYANAPGDLWVRITRDCNNTRKDLKRLMDLIENKAAPNVVEEAIKQFRVYYEWKTEPVYAPVSTAKVFSQGGGIKKRDDKES